MQAGELRTLPSGATLFVSVSEYEKVMDLHDALADELRGKGVGTLDVVEIKKAIDGQGEQGLNVIVDKLLALAASKRFKDALFACAEKAVYRPDGTEASSVPFKPGTPGHGVFDNPACMDKARGDFYEIVKAVAEVNLRPFGKALFSMFEAHVAKRASAPASNTAT